MNNKSLTQALGIILIIAGILLLVYQGYTYTKHEEVARVGNLQVTADTKETVYISPIYGYLSLAAGIILVIFTRPKSK